MKKRLVSAVCALVMTGGMIAAPLGESGFGFSSDVVAEATSLYGYYEYDVKEDGTVRIRRYKGEDTELVIPDTIKGKSVTGIGSDVFKDRYSLTSVTLPDSLTSIGDHAFKNCTGLTSVTIPDSVAFIGEWAFNGCTSLTSVTLPESLTSISDNTFYNCTSLTSVTIPDSVAFIGEWAFNRCTNLTSVSFPESLTSIGYNAFTRCTSLTSVTLPDSLTSIGENVFSDCYKLKSVTISDGVPSIPSCAFINCGSLTSVTIPDSVVEIGERAFCNCSKLQTVYLSKNLETIGKEVFRNVSALKNIFIPESVTTIDSNALGYYYDSKNKAYVKYDDFKIYCIKDSAGEKYAIDNGFEYELREAEAKIIPEVTSTPDYNSIDLTWTEVEGAEKYAICGFVNDNWQILAKTDGTSYTLENLKAGTEYRIAVIAKIDGKWEQDFSNAITVTPKAPATPAYPEVTVEYNEQYHQFRLNWTKVPNVQNYGVAVYLAGKWKVQKQDIPATSTSFTSPKLKAGKTYKVLVCAKIDGKWNLSDLSSRVYTVTVR